MYDKNDTPQQWTVHAQLTISHPGINDPNAPPHTHTEQDENGVRVFYTWTSQPSSTVQPPSTTSNITECVQNVGYQKGNLIFTSAPPRRPCAYTEPLNTTNPHPQDSGYSSELLSPNSYASNSLTRRQIRPYDRRCRSTCSIVLSTSINEEPETEKAESVAPSICGRTQSLRCQALAPSHQKETYYGCGDPWCYHGGCTLTDEASTRFSPARESSVASSTNTKRLTTVMENKAKSKDAAVQTTEMVDKCTSPYMKLGEFSYKEQQTEDASREKLLKKRSAYNARSRTEPIHFRQFSPSSYTPDSLESQEPARRFHRSPIKQYGRIYERGNSQNDSKATTESNKKSKTVHIDVYCTGTEQESDASSSDLDNQSASTPQTVFESDKIRVTHVRADDRMLPQTFRNDSPQSAEEPKLEEPTKEVSAENSENEAEDNVSTAYPSQMSSYSGIAGLSSFSSSVPPSWSSYSMSSYAIPDNDYDSIANTSWKDTNSDLSSMQQSRSSLAPTDSLDYVPRKLLTPQKSDSIEERPEAEAKTLLQTATDSSVRSDSFEYANSDDKIRIKAMEHMWNRTQQKPWRSPHLERRHLLQQQKLKEYLEKKIKEKEMPKWESKDSDSDGSDDSEKGWSITKDVKRPDNISSSNKSTDPVPKLNQNEDTSEVLTPKISIPLPVELAPKRQSFPQRSPSIAALQQRLISNPSLRAPFTIVPGVYTDQRYVAKRFGSIIDAFKKPGHHIGPAKNPDCTCDHCRNYFETYGYRNRARSVGEVPFNPYQNWRRNRSSQPRD